MTRRVPASLYEEVYSLTEAIVQPEVGASAGVDAELASSAYAALRALYDRLDAAGTPDPFVTEALADFSDESNVAILLYRVAIQQSAAFPGEVTYTKRIGLARRLATEGRNAEALEQVALARLEAVEVDDADAVRELEEISSGIAA